MTSWFPYDIIPVGVGLVPDDVCPWRRNLCPPKERGILKAHRLSPMPCFVIKPCPMLLPHLKEQPLFDLNLSSTVTPGHTKDGERLLCEDIEFRKNPVSSRSHLFNDGLTVHVVTEEIMEA